ncbi:MAG: tetratricopeptide repeat protein [Acidobacteriota bacterium]
MICQLCSASNPDEADYCARCGHRLLVVSGGGYTEEDQDAFDTAAEETLSLDEHLLERVSVLEEVVRRTARSMRQVLGTLYKLEQKILINQTSTAALRDLLERKRLVGRQEWSELWEERADRQLLALEKRERFQQVRDSIAGLYSGERRERFAGLLQQAEMALLGLDIGGAVEALGEAHVLDPSNHELSFFLGETCFNEGQLGDALRFFTRVLAVKPRHFESLVYSGVLCHEKGREERATRLLERAVELYPDAFLPAFSLGAVRASRGQIDGAIASLEAAVATGETLPQASYLLGSCYFERRRLGLAIRHLEDAVRQDPAFEEAHLLLGLATLERGWPRKARASFNAARRLQPCRLEYRELVLFLGPAEELFAALGEGAGEALREAEAALGAGQERRALSAFRRALAFDVEQSGGEAGSPALGVVYAAACVAMRRLEEAESAVQRVLDDAPGEPFESVARAAWIEALRDHGRLAESGRLARELIDRAEGDRALGLAYFEMASHLAETGDDPDLALSCAERSLGLLPAELSRFPLAERGWVLLRQKSGAGSVLEAAAESLGEARSLGASKRTLTRLGLARLAAGDLEGARDALEEAWRLESGRGGLQITVLEALKDGARLLQDASPRAASGG